ncbi:unnamed protein product [Peronospora belbahrii]|uniref:Uncharacterized protein n=1 Tax=Peronospora belbahrii TaxID=622444 RepID=A0AAU9L2A6_9STRA|nr:unnamed protein product [Peronospora belbahrii]
MEHVDHVPLILSNDRCRNGEVRENRQFFLVTRKVFGDKSFTLSLLETVISTHRYIHTDLSCLRLRIGFLQAIENEQHEGLKHLFESMSCCEKCILDSN